MIIRVIESSGEIGRIKRIFSYDMRIDVNSPDFGDRFNKEREKALLRYADLRKKIIESIK